MPRPYTRSLFIFRRDLRVQDNVGLRQALESSEEVVVCFFLDPRQIDPHHYRSSPALRFMHASLCDLEAEVTKRGGRLFFFHTEPEARLPRLIKTSGSEAVFVNRDYTPFSQKRDKALAHICKKQGVDFYACDDALLTSPDDVSTSTGTPYKLFTPFWKTTSSFPVPEPQPMYIKRFFSGKLPKSVSLKPLESRLDPPLPNPFRTGGRREALNILRDTQTLRFYAKKKDMPAEDATSGLSAHLKFGTVSVREVYHAVRDEFGGRHPLLRQLYWRDFFTHLAHHEPNVFRGPFYEKFASITWNKSRNQFRRWCEGKTGIPIVDAGMRQLNETGWMPNRLRLITASFLVKDLLINWQWGERYFAQHLIDYDPCVNNGNWQWVAGTGADAQPYFRTFNPWIQQKKIDPKAVYIKRWIPELKEVAAKRIHQLEKKHLPEGHAYPQPIVDHARAKEAALIAYKRVTR